MMTRLFSTDPRTHFWFPQMIALILLLFASCCLAAIAPLRQEHGSAKCNHGHHHLEKVVCDFVVVGGGPGGSHAAYQYAKRYGKSKKVCVFEKSPPETGCGRFMDILQPNGERIPMGGLRWYETGNSTTQLYTQLANELGIERHGDYLTDWVVTGHQQLRIRGLSNFLNSSVTDQQRERYSLGQFDSPDVTGELYAGMVASYKNDPNDAASNASVSAWAQRLFNDEALWLLKDTDRYRSDFKDANDAPSWMEGYLWDGQFDGPRTYPNGGMSSFCRGMLSRVEEEGGLVFYGDNAEVLSIKGQSTGSSDFTYELETKKYRIEAPSLAIAVPGIYLANMTGNIVEAIRDTKFYKAYLPDKVAIVGQTWPRKWWLEAEEFTSGQAQLQDGFNSYAHIFTEATPYESNQNLTRSVYCDDLDSILLWESAYATQGIEGIAKQARLGLQVLYPTVDIPEATSTLYHVHPAGWSWLKAGSYDQGITTATLNDWAVNPLSDLVPECSLMLPTDAWAVQESGWVAGAWGTTVSWMNRCHGTSLSNDYNVCQPYFAPPLSQSWCDCDGAEGQIIPPEGLAYRELHCPGFVTFRRHHYGPRR